MASEELTPPQDPPSRKEQLRSGAALGAFCGSLQAVIPPFGEFFLSILFHFGLFVGSCWVALPGRRPLGGTAAFLAYAGVLVLAIFLPFKLLDERIELPDAQVRIDRIPEHLEAAGFPVETKHGLTSQIVELPSQRPTLRQLASEVSRQYGYILSPSLVCVNSVSISFLWGPRTSSQSFCFVHPATRFTEGQGRSHERPDVAREIILEALEATPRLSPKGRAQDLDYNRKIPMVELVEENGKSVVSGLISLMESERLLAHQVVDFWPGMAVGDLAFLFLVQFFTDETWEPVFPELSWAELLEVSESKRSGHSQFYDFIAANGREALRLKVEKFWSENRDRIYWDSKSRSFQSEIPRAQVLKVEHVGGVSRAIS